MTDPQDKPEPDAIEVEFTDAKPSPAPTVVHSGPGWIGLAVVGVIAALAGGAIGVVAGGTGGRFASAEDVAINVSELRESDRALQQEVTTLREAQRNTEIKLSAEDDAIRQSGAAAGEQLAILSDELSAIKTAYIALVGEPPADGANPDEPATSPEGATDSVPAPQVLPQPGVSLASLLSRLDVMDSTGGSGNTPAARELVRTVAALQERTAALEAADQAVGKALDDRTQQIAALREELTTLESTVTLQVDGQSAADEAGKEAVANIEKEIEGLRALLNEKLISIEAAKLSANEQALVRRADKVLALSSLETSIRSGGPFTSELEALALQLPANARVSQLRRFADQGAPTREQLREELVALRNPVTKAGLPEQKTGQWAWLEDIQNVFVTVREEGSGRGEAPSQKLAESLALLDADDLAGAVQIAREIDGKPGEILATWIERAGNRVQADKLLAQLRNEVISQEDTQ